MRAVEVKGSNDHFTELNIHGHKVSNLRLTDDTDHTKMKAYKILCLMSKRLKS